MAPGLFYIQNQWQSARQSAREAAQSVLAASRDQNLSQEGRQRLMRGFAARGALSVAKLMAEAKATRRELLGASEKVQPKRSADPVDAMTAHRLLDQLHRLDDQALQSALAVPENRAVVGRYATALDAAQLEKRMPQIQGREFRVAAIRDELAAQDHPERFSDARRRVQEIDGLLADMAATFSLLQTGDANTLLADLDADGAIRPTPGSRALYAHLTDDPGALAGAHITLAVELQTLEEQAAALSQTAAAPARVPVQTSSGATIA